MKLKSNAAHVIDVSWNEPEEINGLLESYQITYYNETGEEFKINTTSNPYKLEDLISCINYTVQVAAITRAGIGELNEDKLLVDVEGMKAFKTKNKELVMFRPELNMFRLKCSMEAISLPDFDGDELLKCTEELIRMDRHLVPE